MLYYSAVLCLLAASTVAIPAVQEKRAAPAKLPACYKNQERDQSSNFDLKDGSILVDGAPAVGTDGALMFPTFHLFNTFLSQIDSENGNNVAITSAVSADASTKAQFLPADSSVNRFSMRKMYLGCASLLAEKAAECTIKLTGLKKQKDAAGKPVTTTRTVNYKPGSLLDGQLKSQLTEVDFTGDLFKDVASVTLNLVGSSNGIYIVVDALSYGVCLV